LFGDESQQPTSPHVMQMRRQSLQPRVLGITRRISLCANASAVPASTSSSPAAAGITGLVMSADGGYMIGV
jgi:hypothetical protein